MPLSYSLDTVGPLTRRVEDSALLMRILAGADPRDPTASALPVEDYLKAARSGAVRGLKLAVPRRFFWDKLNKPSAELLEQTLKVRSEEHTSELQSLMRISYAVFCLKKKQNNQQ